MSETVQPIIVIKKKGGHGGHHGGAWKVAYADFVTAMMSLFIVLWLMGSSEKVKRAVAGYFNDPKGIGSQLGTTMTGTGETVSQAIAERVKQRLQYRRPQPGSCSSFPSRRSWGARAREWRGGRARWRSWARRP